MFFIWNYLFIYSRLILYALFQTPQTGDFITYVLKAHQLSIIKWFLLYLWIFEWTMNDKLYCKAQLFFFPMIINPIPNHKCALKSTYNNTNMVHTSYLIQSFSEYWGHNWNVINYMNIMDMANQRLCRLVLKTRNCFIVICHIYVYMHAHLK